MNTEYVLVSSSACLCIKISECILSAPLFPFLSPSGFPGRVGLVVTALRWSPWQKVPVLVSRPNHFVVFLPGVPIGVSSAVYLNSEFFCVPQCSDGELPTRLVVPRGH